MPTDPGPGTVVLAGADVVRVNRYLGSVGARRLKHVPDGATWFRTDAGVFLRAAPDGRGTHGVTAHARCGC